MYHKGHALYFTPGVQSVSFIRSLTFNCYGHQASNPPIVCTLHEPVYAILKLAIHN